jgi:CTP:molybdopterin cytidylyltransferase MocA
MNHISAILLAAGQSTRMGSNKQLLPLAGKPFIRHCIDNLFEAGVNDIVVVLGPSGNQIEPVISELPVFIVWNSVQESDMAGSVRIGVNALPDNVTGVLVCLGDHPLVKATTIQKISDHFVTHPDKIIIPRYDGKKGHPTLFPRAVIEEIFAVSTLRDIVHRSHNRLAFLDISDPGVTMDIDTPKDFEMIATAGINR